MEALTIERIMEHTGEKYLSKIMSLKIPDELKIKSKNLNF